MTLQTEAGTASESVVCYCYNRTSRQLQSAYSRLGKLAAVQKETRAGTKCGGCRLVLESMFGENPDEINIMKGGVGDRNLCVRKGQLLMKGFVAADHRLDTVVFASNGVPPQFAGQDLRMPIEYMLLDGAGRPVLHRSSHLETNETFSFDTRLENIPRPFYGMFLFLIGRANYGGARFNTVWTNGVSACSTHEINDSGRPTAVLPIPVDDAFQQGPNSIHLAMQNPHDWPIRLNLQVFIPNGSVLEILQRDLPPRTTQWLDVSRELFAPVFAANPGQTLCLRIESDPVRVEFAPTLYFFLRNLNTDIWSANHL